MSGQDLSPLLCGVCLAAALFPVWALMVCREELGQALLTEIANVAVPTWQKRAPETVPRCWHHVPALLNSQLERGVSAGRGTLPAGRDVRGPLALASFPLGQSSSPPCVPA